MDKKHLKITRPSQFEKLVALLHEQPELARGKGQFGSSKQRHEEQWDKVTVELNSLGPPSRTSKEWQRVWIHYKANLIRKLANNKKNITTTGGGPSEHINLNQMEESVVGLIELQTAVNPNGFSFGMNQPVNSPHQSNGDDENVPPGSIDPPPVTVERTTHRKRSIKTMEEERLAYLKTQTENQTGILQELKKIEKISYKNYELNKKKFEQKKKALEISTNIFELKKKNYAEATELHIINFQLKKRKLELINFQLDTVT